MRIHDPNPEIIRSSRVSGDRHRVIPHPDQQGAAEASAMAAGSGSSCQGRLKPVRNGMEPIGRWE